MNSIARYALAATALMFGMHAIAQVGTVPSSEPRHSATPLITFFGREGFEGRSITTDKPVSELEPGFSARASSAVVSGEWEVCDGPGFTGRCVIMLPGEYPSLGTIGLNNRISSARLAGAHADPRFAAPQIAFYGEPGFRGKSFVSLGPVSNLERAGRASSLVVLGTPWQVCDGERFSGRCVVLPPGRYPSFGVIGLEGVVVSARPAG